MDIIGKRIIATGGARGIGGAAIGALVAAGAKVASLDVLDDLGEAVVARANEAGPGEARYLHCNIADRTETEAAFKAAVDFLGGLDAMINIAGVERSAPAELIADAEWDLIFDVNVRGTLNTNQAAFPYLRDNGGGRIINFGSAAGIRGMPYGAHYSASKGAVLAWTRTVAVEWAQYNITANAVAPGIWTPMYDAHRSKLTPEQLVLHDERMRMSIPLGGKLGDPVKDLAPVLVFLVSDGARFITAQTLPVDGGLIILS